MQRSRRVSVTTSVCAAAVLAGWLLAWPAQVDAQSTGGSIGGAAWGAGGSSASSGPARGGSSASSGPVRGVESGGVAGQTFDVFSHPVETIDGLFTAIGVGGVLFLGFVIVTGPYAMYRTVRMVRRSLDAQRELRRRLKELADPKDPPPTA